MTSNEIIVMFAERKNLNFGTTSGSAWAQRNGSEGASFWVSQKQANWVIGVFSREVKADCQIDFAEGETYLDGQLTRWRLQQTSRKSNNGAGLVQLAR